jgi:hypothetical protein
MDGERLYSDKEVEALLARSVELSRTGDGPRPRGVSLAELERIAAEAGLSVEALRRAASELDSGRAAASRSAFRRLIAAEPKRARLSLAEAPSEAALGRLLLVLPDIADGFGGSGAVADGSLVWRSEKSMEIQNGMSLRIEAGPDPGGRGGYVEIRVSYDGAAGGVYGGLIGGLGLGGGLGVGLGVGLGELHSTAFALVVPVAALCLSALMSRGIAGLVSRWARKQASRIAEEIFKRLQA